MNESAQVLDLSLARLAKLEHRISGAEGDGLRARWEFGHELLAARDGKGRLPNGYLARVAGETGASRSELKARAQFAERFQRDEELADAIGQFRSWYRIVHEALPAPRPELVVEPDGLPDLPAGVFRTIVADPPWQYDNKATRGAAEDHYATLTIAQLCELPVEERAADEAHLYLWTTNGFLREAFEVMEAWGFGYRTTITWVKPQLGMGNYWRSSTEHVLFGIRGGLRTQDKTLRNWFKAPRGRHSQKPDLFLDLVERASPAPRLELFARRQRMGWDTWGAEALHHVEVS